MTDSDNQKMILIVDDTPRNLQLLAEILFEEGYEIGIAESGPATLEYLEKIKPDLILLDIMMPGMDGFETCEIIKADPKCSDIPIIFLSAKNDTTSVVKGFKLGATDYVTKPFNSTELIARVKMHLELRSKRQELANMNVHLENLVDNRTQELQIANKKLSELDTTKSYFIGLLSHELNTPLTDIIGGAAIISEMTEDPETKEFIEIIQQSAERLKHFSEISQLIANLTLDKYQFNLEQKNICTFFRDTTQFFAQENTDKEINYLIEIPEQEILMNLDYSLVEQMVKQILNNAYRFTEEGEIKVYTQIIDNDYVVKISDTGIGFSETALQNAFTLFQSDELMSHSDGLGLSLATAKIIMHYHQGRITVENNSSGGACISLFFPTI